MMRKISTIPLLLMLGVYVVCGSAALALYGAGQDAVNACVSIFIGGLGAFATAYVFDLLK